jgi:hypothetical protein
MREAVWSCYKRLVWVGRSYPTGWVSIRDKVKAAFFRNSHVTDDGEVASLVARADFVERELEALRKLHKCAALAHFSTRAQINSLSMYRALKRNYEWDLEDELLSCDASRAAAAPAVLKS